MLIVGRLVRTEDREQHEAELNAFIFCEIVQTIGSQPIDSSDGWIECDPGIESNERIAHRLVRSRPDCERVLANLHCEVGERGQGRSCGNELADASKVLNRHAGRRLAYMLQAIDREGSSARSIVAVSRSY